MVEHICTAGSKEDQTLLEVKQEVMSQALYSSSSSHTPRSLHWQRDDLQNTSLQHAIPHASSKRDN